MSWYVKNADGKVFGPVDDASLLSWVKDGRVDPFAGISQDLKSWRLASLEPFLEMDWVVENEPGRFYGPTHRAVVDDLVKSGALSSGCRIYRDDHGGAGEMEVAAIRREAETAMAELKEEAERSIAEAEASAAAAREELSAVRRRAEEGEAKVAELEAMLAKLTETRQREWTTDVVEPEVIADAPPASVRDAFAGASSGPGALGQMDLARLERQAQAELARMGASGAKRFFKMKR